VKRKGCGMNPHSLSTQGRLCKRVAGFGQGILWGQDTTMISEGPEADGDIAVDSRHE
jgi:hypothetical protein